MSTIISLPLILGTLLGLSELSRRYRWFVFAFYAVMPILLFQVWRASGIDGWFEWVKLYSVIFAVIWFTFFRYTELGTKNHAKFIVALILFLNILEAVVKDITGLTVPHILNALAGIFCLLTLSNWRKIAINKSCQDLVWPGLTWFWIIAYTIWNWVFVYLNFIQYASDHIAVLLASLVVAFFKCELWLQSRAFILGAWMMYFFTFPNFLNSQIIWLPENDSTRWFVALVSFGVNLAQLLFHFLPQRTGITAAKN